MGTGAWAWIAAAAWAALAVVGVAGCDALAGSVDRGSPAGADGGAAPGPTDGSPPVEDAAADAGDDVPPAGDAGLVPCTVTFRYAPEAGTSPKSVAVGGEWSAFAPPGQPMVADASGFHVDVPLTPGLWGYKLVVDGVLVLDPASGLRKYVGGVENSGVEVPDCRAPTLSLATRNVARAAAGQGHFTATVAYRDGVAAAGIAPASVKATLRTEGAVAPILAVTLKGGEIDVDVPRLADGKYTVMVEASDRAGRAATPLRLVFWVEGEVFDWRDAVIYMAMVDRFKDGNAANNPPPQPGVDPRADYHGGDLEGVRQEIAAGTFDALGVRALWLSPFHANPKGAFRADDGVHLVTGYHGYWPTRAREVDARIGGEAALKALVKEAHAHGIRVMQDFVVNHVHQDHEYFAKHPEWFRTGCVCGTDKCDWTVHRLDCLFASYMPDVNWTLPEVNAQFADDAVWWMDTFNLDGLRIDAVKHVEDAAVMNLASRIRREFEAAGTRVFLTGETAMGWSDCGACNADQYGTISRYIGPHGLDGQADFVLYHGVPYRTFASGEKGMIHVDYWSQESTKQYPAGAIMTPFIGSQDNSRFTTLASYRGQDAAHDPSVAGNKWANIASAPPDAEPYARHRLALTWLLGQPGAPLVYYGDEYGEWGGADPNNRPMWRGGSALAGEEQSTLLRTRALGQARRELVALRRGTYVPVLATEDVLVFGRKTGSDFAIVALTRAATAQPVTVTLPAALGVASSVTLRDRLGGANVTVSGGVLVMTLPPRGAAVLAP